MNVADLELKVSYDSHVATVEMNRPPNNFINSEVITEICTAIEELQSDDNVRAILLASGAKHFCAGADLGAGLKAREGGQVVKAHTLYEAATRLLRTRKPLIAAVNGAAVGAGLGLAAVCDFRVTTPEARFSANFTRQGYHPGFGLTYLLPKLIGEQKASLLFLTGRRISGVEAHKIGLADLLVEPEDLRGAAHRLAEEIAECGPRAIEMTRETLRGHMADEYFARTQIERAKQNELRDTADYKEGVRAMNERRLPIFNRT